VQVRTDFDVLTAGLQNQGYFQGVYCNTADNRFYFMTLLHHKLLISHNLRYCDDRSQFPGNNVNFAFSWI